MSNKDAAHEATRRDSSERQRTGSRRGNERSERTRRVPTRRDTIKYGGAVVGGGLLAGCIGDSDGSSGAYSSTETITETTTTEDSSYTVTIKPAGEVSFNAVPKTWVAENASWADMGVALGLSKPSAVVLTGEYRTWHYEDIPGLSTSKDDMVR